MKELSVYIHIPFCVKKCYYCDFLSAPAEEGIRKRYVDCLLSEMGQEAEKYGTYEVVSVFFGGGTPSVLKTEDTARIMAFLKKNFRLSTKAEITTEINPKTADTKKLAAYAEMGFNRLSIGLQSANDSELEALGRIHSYQEFLEVYGAAKRVGFSNINVDVMSALPGQSMESYINTLEKVLGLGPSHISAYSLIIEEGTPFFEWYGKKDAAKKGVLPSEETERAMYEATKKILEERGYRRYEISNYARDGYECVHNKAYWTRKEYVGFGIGAASLVRGIRFRNTSSLETYLSGKYEKEERAVLTKNDCMEEFMFLGLRLMEGVQKQEFFRQFGIPMENVYGEVLEKMQGQGLLVSDSRRVYLTRKGIDVSNYVMAEFLL